MYIVTLALWQWYAYQLDKIKSPSDGLRYSVQMARAWQRESHIEALLHKSLRTGMNLDYMQVSFDDNNVANKVLSLTWTLASHRCWSLAARHARPPWCYALILSADVGAAQSAVDKMRRI